MIKNVLSVDWDYFMDCTENERLLMFPDGGNENLGLNLSTLVWLGRYATSKYYTDNHPGSRGLIDIGIKEKAFSYVCRNIVLNVNVGCRILFADSHAEIYDFIRDGLKKKDKVSVYNIDHHSDCYNIGDELNCGNWVNKLSDDGVVSKYTWVRDDVKEEIKGLNCDVVVTEDITDLEDINWDMIFICRSSIWSPPHLDTDFNSLYEHMAMFLNLNFNPAFFIDRYALIEGKLESELDCVKQMNEMLESTLKHNKENCDCTEQLDKLKEIFDSCEEEESSED